MLIGRQEDTGYGGRIDLLAITPDASLVLIELKRARTPREVVAQALDYAGWVEGLRADEIAAIYERFSSGRSLAADFLSRFQQKLDEDSLNQNHQIIIVASSPDDSTERIISYLNDRDVPINVLFFQVFNTASEQLLSRSWLLDPVRTQITAAATSLGPSEPWNGEFYCSFGEGHDRSWVEAMQYGFISGGWWRLVQQNSPTSCTRRSNVGENSGCWLRRCRASNWEGTTCIYVHYPNFLRRHLGP